MCFFFSEDRTQKRQLQHSLSAASIYASEVAFWGRMCSLILNLHVISLRSSNLNHEL